MTVSRRELGQLGTRCDEVSVEVGRFSGLVSGRESVDGGELCAMQAEGRSACGGWGDDEDKDVISPR